MTTPHFAPRRPAAWPWCLALALALAAPACASNPKSKPDPEKQLELHRELALRYFDEGDLLRAEDQVSRGLDIDPKDEKLQLMLGWVRQRRGSRDDIQIAEKIFRSLLDKRDKDKDYRAQLGLAEALERKGILYQESADAIASGRRVSQAADPEQRVERMRRDAEAFWDESIAMYKTVLERRPEEPQVFNGLQRVYSLRGEDEKALKWSRLLLEQNERDLEFWRTRLQQPDLTADEEADVRELMGRTTRLQIETHLQAATLLVRLDRKSESIGHLDSVLVLAPDLANAYSRRAEILHGLGRDEEAVANLDEFLRLSDLKFEHPDIRRAFELRAECEAAIQAKQVDTAR